MTPPPARFAPERFIHGESGPVAVVPGRVAALLARQFDLHRLRTSIRGRDAEVDSVLLALKSVAEEWRSRNVNGTGSGTRTTDAADSEPAATSTLMTTTQAADSLGVTPRAVQKAIANGRLPAARHGARWLVDADDLAMYQEAKTA